MANVSVPVLAPLNNDFGFLAVNSHVLDRIDRLVLIGGDIISWPTPCGINCSYSISFVSPAYECTDLGPLSSTALNVIALADSNLSNLAAPPVPFINDSLWYYGLSDWGDENNPIGLWVIYNSLNATVHCELYNATYTTNVSYVNNIQFIQNNLEFHNLITNGNALREMAGWPVTKGMSASEIDSW